MCQRLHLHFLVLVVVTGEMSVLCQEECAKTVVTSCADCIRSGPFCAWCKKLNFTTVRDTNAVRCDTEAVLKLKGCEEINIIHPKSIYKNILNEPLSKKDITGNIIQIQPQHINLTLRPGMPYTFQMKFKRAEDYPVDLYYLMDLSYSMKDDLENVKGLGKNLLEALKLITSRARIGFGSFVDKTTVPFTNTHPEILKKPCPEKEAHCQAAFGFKHVLSLTGNWSDFNTKVSAQYISGNLDQPEGSLDAIMQAAVCTDRIGWGNSTRLLVVTTDDGFHMAGDGKLASIYEPNDGKCHLDEDMLYSKSNEMDYPSVGQVAMKLADNNIQTIFAVTKNMEDVYKKLKDIIPKSEIGVLSNDSKNVVGLINDAYKKLSSEVIMSHDELPGISVTYSSNCPGRKVQDTRGICDNVGIGQEVVFNVTVTVHECMEETYFQIGPRGFRDRINVTVTTRCHCECDDPKERTSTHCSSRGKVVCGICSCDAGFAGKMCDCALGYKDESQLREACRQDNGTECSGQGECQCGQCVCNEGDNDKTIYGKYCECNNKGCEVHNHKLCAGNGKCDCDKCICNPGYEGSACQCKTSTEECVKEGSRSVCSGRGDCKCNTCKCKNGYEPPHCEECSACPSPCAKTAACIECLTFQSASLKKDCSKTCKHVVNHTMEDSIGRKKHCKEKDTENCWMIFSMEELDGFDRYKVRIQKKRECPEPPAIGAIIGGTLCGVFLIGVLIVVIIKAVISYYDLKEYRAHEEERHKATWSEENRMFRHATTTVVNPLASVD